MTDDKKIDGWVAWHPKFGLLDYQSSPSPNCTYQVNCLHQNAGFCADSAYVRTGAQFVHGKNKKGWRIRPVKLVYLDEEK